MESKKNTNELIYKTEIDAKIHKTNLWLGTGKKEVELIVNAVYHLC